MNIPSLRRCTRRWRCTRGSWCVHSSLDGDETREVTYVLVVRCCDRPRTQTTLPISLSAVSCASLFFLSLCMIQKTSHVITADTVVFTHALPSTTLEMELGTRQELLEKPISKADHLRMLQDLNGNVCEVVTGVSLGEPLVYVSRTRGPLDRMVFLFLVLVYPVLTAPGYATR